MITQEVILHFFLGMVASFLGGLPFGLVNLSIVHVSVKNKSREAFGIAMGASSIEVIWALQAMFLGSIITGFVNAHPGVRSIMFFIVLAAGIFFVSKKQGNGIRRNESKLPGFLKGALMMLVSFQVVLLWVFFITFYESKNLIDISVIAICFFLPGVFIGKMLAYFIYDRLSAFIRENSAKISKNINYIIGYILITIAGIYLVKLLITLFS